MLPTRGMKTCPARVDFQRQFGIELAPSAQHELIADIHQIIGTDRHRLLRSKAVLASGKDMLAENRQR